VREIAECSVAVHDSAVHFPESRMTVRPVWLRALTAALLMVSAPAALLAQDAGAAAKSAQAQHKTGGNEGKMPIGWKVRTDAGPAMHMGGADTVAFVQMTPGFHVTMGPAAILWHPDSVAKGTYSLESGIFLFPTKGRDQEGYGVFLGGAELAAPGQRYTYFLLRNDGKFLVKQRKGEQTTTLIDWTPLAAIKRQAGADAMRNDFRVVVEASTVRFLVNGTEAVQLPRTQVNPDGVFGLRMNHAVNAHVVGVGRAGR
jgi:hypothetical protein